MSTHISVILATYNRAEILKCTLDSFGNLDLNGLVVEFIIVDNNSTDNTRDLISVYSNKYTIKYIFHKTPGKNSAINSALESKNLGDLVVFTDDDVVPFPDWLKAVSQISMKWPKYEVFGGKILPMWPKGVIPRWAQDPDILSWGFSVHDYSYKECLYKKNEYPFGPNFWVRKEVFGDGRKFDESIGPRPNNRIMGSETSFLSQLAKDGYDILYSPHAVVKHLIRPQQLHASSILKRAVWQGRSIVYFSGVPRKHFHEKHFYIWIIARFASLFKWGMIYFMSYFHLSFDKRILKRIQGKRFFSYHLESIKLSIVNRI